MRINSSRISDRACIIFSPRRALTVVANSAGPKACPSSSSLPIPPPPPPPLDSSICSTSPSASSSLDHSCGSRSSFQNDSLTSRSVLSSGPSMSSLLCSRGGVLMCRCVCRLELEARDAIEWVDKNESCLEGWFVGIYAFFVCSLVQVRSSLVSILSASNGLLSSRN